MKTWLLLAFFAFICAYAQKCDDGNTVPGDGCNGTLIESGDWTCPLKGACKCACVDPKDPKKCGCNWMASQAKVPVHRIRYFDRLAVELKRGSGSLIKGLRFTSNTDEELALEVATTSTTGIDWDETKKQVIQWYGAPMRFLYNLDRIAFECPASTVPTKLYFRRAGCNQQNVNALRDQKNRRSAPPCLALAQNFNEGLSLVTECRPNPALIDSQWKWIDAGIGAPIQQISQLGRLGGVCETGYAMTGVYWKRWGCNSDLYWNQIVARDSLTGRCAANATGIDGKPPTEGLITRIKCTKIDENNFQGCSAASAAKPCGANAKCANVGAFGTRCQCNTGYRGDGYTCEAINPCADGTHTCAPAPVGACRATAPGNFTCSCIAGYTMDARNKCIRNTKPANAAATVIPGFKATCAIDTLDYAGNIYIEATRDSKGTPLGVKITHDMRGPLENLASWDIYEHMVQGSNADCVATGAVYSAPKPSDGIVTDVGALTSKWGRLVSSQPALYDTEIRVWGDYSVVGRSIVLKDLSDKNVACCTIFVQDGAYTPVAPTYAPSGVKAECDFDDGRAIRFDAVKELMGTEEAVLGGHSIGSDVTVNPFYQVRTTTSFATAGATADWYFGSNSTSLKTPPTVETCIGSSILGGNAKLPPGTELVFKKTGLRPFRAVRIQFTFWAFGTWSGKQGYLSFSDEAKGKEYRLWNILPSSTDADWKTITTGCGTVTRYAKYVTADVIYYFQDTQKSLYLEWGTTGSATSGNPSFGLSTAKIFLAPVEGYNLAYTNDFAGNFNRQDWRYGPASGTRWLVPPVQGCPAATPTYFVMGGVNVIKGTDVLEYNRVPEPATSFHKLQIDFTFYFEGTWAAGHVASLDIKNSAGNWVNIWKSTGPVGVTLANCQGLAVRGYNVTGVTANLGVAISKISLRWSSTSTTGSFGVGKFKVTLLPTPKLTTFTRTDFSPALSQRNKGWETQAPRATTWTAAAVGECNWPASSGQHRAKTFDYLMGGANVLGAGWKLRYVSTVPAHKRAIVFFEFWFTRSWDSESGIFRHYYPNPTGAGMVSEDLWKKKFNLNWSRGALCPGHSYRDEAMKTWVEYNLPAGAAPLTKVTFEWTSTLDQEGADEAFALGEFGLWLYPLESQVLLVGTPTADFKNFQLMNRKNQYSPITVPFECSGQKVLGGSITWDNLIVYSTKVARPFEQAIVHFNFWFIDSWDGEWARMDVVHNGRDYTSYLDWSFLYHANSEDLSLKCGPVAGYPWAAYDVVKQAHVPIVVPSSTTDIKLKWQTNLDEVATNEAWGISKFSIEYLPLVASSTVVDQMSSSTTKTGISVLEPTGATVPFGSATCGNGLFLWPKINNPDTRYNYHLSQGRRLRLNLLHTQEFVALRVFFTAHFTNTWDREYAWLNFNSDKPIPGTAVGEVYRLWRNQKEYEGQQNRWQVYEPNLCSSDSLRISDASLSYAVESPQFLTPTKRVQLDWGSDADEDGSNEGFALVGWKVVAVHPPRTPTVAVNLNFADTKPQETLTNWVVISGAFASINFETATGTTPAISQCVGPRGATHYLLGAGTLAKDRHLVYRNKYVTKFTKAYISFRYFFLRSWDNEVGSVIVNGKKLWSGISVHSIHQPDYKCPIGGVVSPTYSDAFSDVTVEYTTTTPVDKLTVIFTSTLDQGHTDESFSISFFKIEFETSDPAYKIQDGCTSGTTTRPQDGNRFTITKVLTPAAGSTPAVINETWWAQGDMTAKHGSFETTSFRDMSLPLSGPTSIVGKTVALYTLPTDTRPVTCCTIKLTASSAKPATEARKILKKTAACAINRVGSVEGEVSVVAPSDRTYGGKVEINLRFFGDEVKASHDVYIAPKGYSPLDLKTIGCPTAKHNPASWIGPQKQARPGLVPWPNSADGTIVVGDITSKGGKIAGNTDGAVVYYDGQITLTGAHSVVGRTVVVTGSTGTPLACCVLGLGLVGSEKDPYVTGEIGADSALTYPDYDPPTGPATSPPPGPGPTPGTTGGSTPTTPPSTGGSTPTPTTPGGPTPTPSGTGGIHPAPTQHVIPGTGRRDLNGTLEDEETRKYDERDDLSTGEITGIALGVIFGTGLLIGAALFAAGGVPAGAEPTGDYVAL